MMPATMSDELDRRLGKLESQVAWLMAQEQQRATHSATPGMAPAPIPPRPPLPRPPAARPAAPPRPPSKPINPTVWIAAAGSGIFLIGIIFFLVWSIQQGWLGPEMRLLLGLAAGVTLTLVAGRLILGSAKSLGVAVLLAGLGTLQFSFRAGAFNYHFFPASLGLAGAALATVLAGALAARAKSGGALCMALISGLMAPVVFSEGGHHEVALAVYLAVLMASVLAVPYLSGQGARWGTARWFAILGTWILLAVSSLNGLSLDSGNLLLLLVLHLVLSGLWIWLPGCEEKPTTPTLLWILTSLAATSLGVSLWKDLGWPAEWYAGPVLALAALNLAMVKPLRERLGSRQADLGLLVLAAGHLACAVPIALAWRWVGPLWALLALGLAWASHKAEDGAYAEEASALRKLAFGMAALASLRWLIHGFDLWFSPSRTPFLNAVFIEGAIGTLAWLLLARRGGVSRAFAVVALELLGNLTLAFECAHLVRFLRSDAAADWEAHRASDITITLVLALSGALQWLAGVRSEPSGGRVALLAAGYTWLGIASTKLVLADLAQADTPLRALAFLGVGGIFLVAALVANRFRPEAG
jgi:uncharacterized membrane protein